MRGQLVVSNNDNPEAPTRKIFPTTIMVTIKPLRKKNRFIVSAP